MSALSTKEQELLNRIMARQTSGAALASNVSKLRQNAISPTTAQPGEGAGFWDKDGFTGTPTDLRVLQEGAMWGVQSKAPRIEADPERVKQARADLLDSQWMRADGLDPSTGKPLAEPLPPMAPKRGDKRWMPQTSPLRGGLESTRQPYINFGGESGVAYGGTKPQKSDPDTPVRTSLSVDDFSEIQAGAADGPDIPDGQVVQSSDGRRHYKRKNGQIIPHIQDVSGAWQPRDKMLTEWANANATDPVSQRVRRALQMRHQARDHAGSQTYTPGEVAQGFRESEAALNAAADEIEARGGFDLEQQGPTAKPMTPADVDRYEPRPKDPITGAVADEKPEDYRARKQRAQQKHDIFYGTEPEPEIHHDAPRPNASQEKAMQAEGGETPYDQAARAAGLTDPRRIVKTQHGPIAPKSTTFGQLPLSDRNAAFDDMVTTLRNDLRAEGIPEDQVDEQVAALLQAAGYTEDDLD